MIIDNHNNNSNIKVPSILHFHRTRKLQGKNVPKSMQEGHVPPPSVRCTTVWSINWEKTYMEATILPLHNTKEFHPRRQAREVELPQI